MSSRYSRNRTLMWILFAVLVVLHHDWWFWNDGRLRVRLPADRAGLPDPDLDGRLGPLGLGRLLCLAGPI